MNGWIKLHRKTVEWGWFSSPHTAHFFLYCLMKANPQDDEWRGETVERGSFISSLGHMSGETGLTIKAIRIAIQNLQKTGEIIFRGANKWSKIIVCKYDEYQADFDMQGQAQGQAQGHAQGHAQGQQIEKREERKEKYILPKGNEEKDDLFRADYGAILELWNATCTSLAKITKMTDGRRRKVKARLGEMGGDPMETLRTLFAKVQASDFCKGGNKHGWRVSFDWLFENSNNWVKVMEGNYDNKAGDNKTSGSVRLGAGEFLRPDGTRTYGYGRFTVPLDAPPRPTERHQWNDNEKQWITL